MKIKTTSFKLILLAVLLLPLTAQSAFVTTNEAGLDSIFSQSSFGANPIDIRFLSTNTIIAPALLSIQTNTDLNNLFGMATDPFNVINLFYVNTIDWCGSFNTAIVGCATNPSNKIMIESNAAAGSSGAEIMAHEIGHNLGLSHESFANLMTGSVNGNTDLVSAQVTTINSSSLVQSDGAGRYINIRPILVTTAVVPVPGALFFMLSGLFTLAYSKYKRPALA